MRDRQEIEKEMYRAREDLEQNINELKHAVREKVDVPARARAAIGEKKQQAKELAQKSVDGMKKIAVRGKDGVVYVYGRARDGTKEHPYLVAGIAVGVIAATVGIILLVRYQRRPWYKRF